MHPYRTNTCKPLNFQVGYSAFVTTAAFSLSTFATITVSLRSLSILRVLSSVSSRRHTSSPSLQ